MSIHQNPSRKWKSLRTYHAVGRTSHLIECPWCGERFVAYLWSMAGSGKNCPCCKALHVWHDGLAYQR